MLLLLISSVPLILAVPLTSSFAPGVVVPMPTFPKASILNFSVLVVVFKLVVSNDICVP